MKAGGRIQEAKAGVRSVKGWGDPEALNILMVQLSQDHCSVIPQLPCSATESPEIYIDGPKPAEPS